MTTNNFTLINRKILKRVLSKYHMNIIDIADYPTIPVDYRNDTGEFVELEDLLLEAIEEARNYDNQ